MVVAQRRVRGLGAAKRQLHCRHGHSDLLREVQEPWPFQGPHRPSFFAVRAGVKVCMDLNSRAKLWDREHAADVLSLLPPQVDVLIASEADADPRLGLPGADFRADAKGPNAAFGVSGAVATRALPGCVWGGPVRGPRRNGGERPGGVWS